MILVLNLEWLIISLVPGLLMKIHPESVFTANCKYLVELSWIQYSLDFVISIQANIVFNPSYIQTQDIKLIHSHSYNNENTIYKNIKKLTYITIHIYNTFIYEVLKRIWPEDAQQGETSN